MNAHINHHQPQALVVSSAGEDTAKSLRAARMSVVSTENIDGCVGKIPAGTSLVVLLPDDFRFDQVVGVLFALRRERPDVHAVLVTETPERFAKLVVAADNAPPPSIIQMPASAWTILEAAAQAAAADAKRSHAGGFEAGGRPVRVDPWGATGASCAGVKSK